MPNMNTVRRDYEHYKSRVRSLSAELRDAESNVRRYEGSYLDARDTGRSSSTVKKARKQLEKWRDIRDDVASELQSAQRKADQLRRMLNDFDGTMSGFGGRMPPEIAEYVVQNTEGYRDYYHSGRRY
ncbi:hypothetical protein NHJ13051_009768 [Beauveria bassiana]